MADQYASLILIFDSIVFEALPFIVLGVVLAGILEEFVPQQAITRVIPDNRFLAILLGGMLGAVFPMCECGIIVVMKRLLRKGLPLSVCITYMLAGPIINVVVLGSTYVAFNPPEASEAIFGGPWNVLALRAGLAFVVACSTGMVVDVLTQRVGLKSLLHPSVMRGLDVDAPSKSATPLLQRLGNISQTALNDFVDIMAFLILGACLAAGGRYVLQGLKLEETVQNHAALSILLMMLIAVLFCLCSEADAFVAANFPLYWPAASKLAFLVLGPMLDLKLYLMYTRVFRPRLIYTIIACVVVQVFAYTMVVHQAESLGWLPTSTLKQKMRDAKGGSYGTPPAPR